MQWNRFLLHQQLKSTAIKVRIKTKNKPNSPYSESHVVSRTLLLKKGVFALNESADGFTNNWLMVTEGLDTT